MTNIPFIPESAPFTAEQRAFADSVADFCQRETGTRAQRDVLTNHGTELHSQDLYKKMAELGWTGILIPEEYGGAGAGNVEMCILLEESLRGGAPIGGIGPTLITAAGYQKFAGEEMKRDVLAGVVAGDSLSVSMSEPEAGSDVAALSCRADKVDGGWLINGQKTWCSNAHFAKSILLIARTDKNGKKHEGLTQFHVPAGTPGLEIRGMLWAQPVPMEFLLRSRIDLVCLYDSGTDEYASGMQLSEDDFGPYFEAMRRDDGQYELGAVLGWNTDPVVPGRGSAIFLHVWKGPDEPTSGCVALSREHVATLLAWLDAAAVPCVVVIAGDR